jgi:2,4-dienoyl-CoA reductase-like NADH-dependent reductase (Old Yellow Enzyme family)
VNLRDGFEGGLELDESIEVARLLEAEGATALVLSGGFVSRTPLFMLRGEVPVRRMAAAQEAWHARLGLTLFGRLLVQAYPYTEGFFLEEAMRMRAAVRLPLVLLGGVKSMATIDRALAAGFELVGMGRALLHDPALPGKLLRGEASASGCVPCNECIAEMDRGGVRCTRRGG